MLKRVLSLTLALVLSLSVCVVTDAKTVYSDDLEFKYEILTALGIVNEDGKSDYSVFRDLSKSSFINLICNMYGDYGFTMEYNKKAIRTAEDLGIIHKGQTDLYKPLQYDEAMTMLVRLLGYGVHAEQAGGYPVGYINIANKLGITDGLRAKSGGALQEYDGITLLYNTLNSAYVDIIKITDKGIVYGDASDRTFLYEFRKIYRVEGIMESSGMASIDTNVPAEIGTVIINGYRFKADEDFSQNLGMMVEAYVQEQDATDKILFASPRDNTQVVVPAEQIVGMSRDCRTFTYYNDKDKEIKAPIALIPAVLYNGQAKAYSQADFKPEDGQVVLVNSDSDKEYDAVFITDYKTMVVESVSKSEMTVRNVFTYDASNRILDLEPELEDAIHVYYEGSEIEVEDILPGDVLRYAESTLNERRIINVYVSRKEIAGTLTGRNVKNGVTYLTVDGEQYPLSKNFIKAENATPNRDVAAEVLKLGSSYTFSLDNAGAIAFVKVLDSNTRYAILKGTASEGTFVSTGMVWLFTTEGTWKEYNLAKKVDYTDATGTTTRYNSQQAANQLAVDKHNIDILVFSYTLNADGEIRTIQIPKQLQNMTEVAAVDTDDEFNYYSSRNDPAYGENSVKYLGSTASFAMEVYVDNGATVWFVDTQNLNDEKSYTLQNVSALGTDNSGGHIYRAYNLDRFGFTNLLIIETPSEPYKHLKSDLFIVEDVQTVLAEDGENRTIITGMMGSYDLISYYCDEDVTIRRNERTTTDADTSTILSAGVQGLRKGDVVAIHINNLGYVDAVELRYVRGTTTEYYQTELIVDNIKVEEYKKNAVIDMKFHGRVSLANHSTNRLQAICDGQRMNFKTATNTLVAVYDMENDTLRRGTINDIETDDFIVVSMTQFKVSVIVVYKHLSQ